MKGYPNGTQEKGKREMRSAAQNTQLVSLLVILSMSFLMLALVVGDGDDEKEEEVPYESVGIVVLEFEEVSFELLEIRQTEKEVQIYSLLSERIVYRIDLSDMSEGDLVYGTHQVTLHITRNKLVTKSLTDADLWYAIKLNNGIVTLEAFDWGESPENPLIK